MASNPDYTHLLYEPPPAQCFGNHTERCLDLRKFEEKDDETTICFSNNTIHSGVSDAE
jgi:hypothetical protein